MKLRRYCEASKKVEGYFAVYPRVINSEWPTTSEDVLKRHLQAIGLNQNSESYQVGFAVFGRTRLGGQIGLITVLHTWEQTLLDQFHLHCLVPAGALSFDQKLWSPARQNFSFSVKALSVVFRGKFLDLLESACARNKLLFVGQSASLLPL